MTEYTQPSVLIFDSGVGGLSVFDEIQQQLPQLNYYYLFDNEAYPYGELEHDTLLRRVSSLITQFVAKHQIDLVVIACNTASTVVLPTLREKLSVPVVGVVPAIKPASALANKAVGLIATPATVERSYTQDLIRNYSPDTPVKLLGSTRLVEMAERKLRNQLVETSELAHILKSLIGEVDVAVLGCTHFPLLKDEIQQVLGKEVVLVDSGAAIARRVKQLLNAQRIDDYRGERQIFSSAPPMMQEALENTLTRWGFKTIQNSQIVI
ncbi:glutamate racemase [Vibrio sp. WXL103]|uniref:glutamate racemase n=1 Tax=Vibrio sp. WXL103 TaxID=3450710 RepID=UPI003EC8DAA0